MRHVPGWRRWDTRTLKSVVVMGTGETLTGNGTIQGLLTIDELLEEVVGDYTTDPQFYARDVHPQEDGSYLVDASANIRELNRAHGWTLPIDGPKTLNGLLLDTLEDIPEAGTSLRVEDYTIEILQVTGRAVKNARIHPPTTKDEVTEDAEPSSAAQSAEESEDAENG